MYENIHVRITKEQYEWLRRYCFENQVSQAEVIRIALEMFREKKEDKGMEEKITLQELTEQESGVVIYGNEGIICNWSSFSGLPRLFATGLIDWPASIIEKVEGEHYEDLSEILDRVEIIYNPGADQPKSGKVYEVATDESDKIIVIAPDGWN
jgi:hypothetical protein